MNIIYFLLALLAFSVLIIGHEFGHFIVAKLNGVKVEEFSIGMGPKLFGKKGNETDYNVRAIPIGGYIKMLGEEGEDTSDARSFRNKNPFQRLLIVAAGPIMNFIIAIILFAIIGFISGVTVPIVNKVQLNTPAYSSGLLKGDKITLINNVKISTWDNFIAEINKNQGKSINITLIRNGNTINKTITPKFAQDENRYIIGIYPSIQKTTFLGSISHGFSQTNNLVKQTFQFLGGLFNHKINFNDVGGPISVMRLSTKAAQQGILTLLFICAYISVQLAIFNLLPIPALDGGWILISIIELIIGRKLNEEKIAKVTYVGFALLMSLAVLVTIKDILYPLKL